MIKRDELIGYVDITLTDTSHTSQDPCKHKTGWFATVKFWIFSRYIFVCSDCGTVLYKKEYELLRRKMKP